MKRRRLLLQGRLAQGPPISKGALRCDDDAAAEPSDRKRRRKKMTVDEIDSATISGMAERVAEGKLSVKGAVKFAQDMTNEGCTKVSVKQLATSCPTSSERDFFRWLKLPIPTYKASVPVKLDASNCAAIDGLGTAEISLVLPSDHLQALHDQGPEVMDECLGSWADFSAMWHASGCGELSSTHVPIIIHEDAVPHFSGSTATIWSWSTGCVQGDAWKTKHAITVIGTPHITEDTRQEICRILAWDFKQLEQGVYDFVGHTGSFHPLKSSREKLAGESMPVKAAFCFWKGDMEAHAYAHRLTTTRRYYLCNQCCDFCLATSDRRAPELSWGDLTLQAPWRHTLTMSDPNDPSPWTQVPRFEKKKRLLDLLHIVHLGTLRDLIPAAIIDSLEDGTLQRFFGLNGRPWNEVLHAFSRHAALWAKTQGMQLYIGTLSMARFGRPKHNHWPMCVLDTRIKAAKSEPSSLLLLS